MQNSTAIKSAFQVYEVHSESQTFISFNAFNSQDDTVILKIEKYVLCSILNEDCPFESDNDWLENIDFDDLTDAAQFAIDENYRFEVYKFKPLPKAVYNYGLNTPIIQPQQPNTKDHFQRTAPPKHPSLIQFTPQRGYTLIDGYMAKYYPAKYRGIGIKYDTNFPPQQA